MRKTNAKEEFLNLIKDEKKVICATISVGQKYYEEQKPAILKKGYTEREFKDFLHSIDINYDAGYGGQELFGTIWFEGQTWATRGEYDGSEWWELNKYPPIPKELK